MYLLTWRLRSDRLSITGSSYFRLFGIEVGGWVTGSARDRSGGGVPARVDVVRPTLAAFPMSLLLLSGCGSGTKSAPTTKLDPAAVLRRLPTPAQGLDQSTVVTTIDASQLQTLLAGRSKPSAAKVYEELRFYDAAVRNWTGPGGARAFAVVSRWPDHLKATNVGGGAVNELTDGTGVAAWTPSDLAGARGARLVQGGTGDIRMLAFAVDDVSMLIRADGPVTDAAIIREMDLLVQSVRAVAPQ